MVMMLVVLVSGSNGSVEKRARIIRSPKNIWPANHYRNNSQGRWSSAGLSAINDDW